MVQSLPGVVTATDARNDIIARGGNPTENFIMIDGIEVPNINHFGTQGATGGPIGMINVDFLEDVTFSAGGFSAKYGDKMSSVMNVSYRDGDKQNTSGKLELGLGGFGLIMEGPVQENKSSYLLSVRRSYLDFIVAGTGLTAVPRWWNFNTKADYKFSDNHSLTFLGLGGIDEINFEGLDDEDDPLAENTQIDKQQGVVGLIHKWILNESTFLRTSLSANTYYSEITVDDSTERTFFNTSMDSEVLLRSDLFHRLSPTDALEMGITARYLRNDNDLFQIEGRTASGGIRPEFRFNGIMDALKFGSFIQYSKDFGSLVSVTASARYDYFDAIENSHAFSPRIAGTINLASNLRLNSAFGLYQQAPALIWLTGDPSNDQLEFMKTVQSVVGLEYFPTFDTKITVEIFNKQYSDIPNSVRNPEYSYGNYGADYVIPTEAMETASEGYARGIEFFFRKKLTDDFYTMINYSFSEIRFTASDGIERPSSFDFGNVFSAIVGYKITDDFEVSFKWRYAGGRPYTPFDEELSSEFNTSIFDYNQFNGLRLPEYHRLDLRADYRSTLFGWSVVSYLDFQNVYSRENVDYLVWNQKTNSADEVLQWQFLPVGGVRIEF
jgi:hypothetical protein